MKARLSIRIVFCLLAITLLLSSLALGLTFLRRANTSAEPSKTSPRLFLWAWERPTDLRFIDTNNVGVAYLAKSIHLKSGDVLIRPRLQPLQLPEGTKVIAVARIETNAHFRPALSVDQRSSVTRAILDMTSLPNISEVQIDFDATTSERDFYRQLIKDVRSALPPRVRFSITALASWCMHDNWISDLPIDEAVPMLFRMTNDGQQILSRLDAGDDFNAAPCRQSYGLSLDETRPRLFASRRLFVFNPDAWMEESVRKIPESNR